MLRSGKGSCPEDGPDCEAVEENLAELEVPGKREVGHWVCGLCFIMVRICGLKMG
jgi:hypothetical protein